MPNYTSIMDAINAHMDKMIEAGIVEESAKVQNIPRALGNLANAYLAQMDSDTAEAVSEANKDLDYDIADQLSFLLDAVGSNLANANPLTALALDANISDSVDLLGLTASDLQENVAVNGRKITGTSKYVEGYTDFSENEDEQSGHYLAVHADVDGQSDVMFKINGVTLDSDQTHVLIIKNKFKPLVVTAEKTGYGKITKSYDLSGLTLAPKEEDEDEGA